MSNSNMRSSGVPLFINAFTETSRIIFTPSPFARQSMPSLQEVGKLRALKPHKSSRSGLNSYLFFIIESGDGTVIYNGESADLHTSDCVFIDCKKEYSQCTDDDHLWSLAWCHFTSPNMAQIYEKYLSRGGRWHFKATDKNIYKVLIQSMYDIAAGDSYVKDMKLATKLTELLEHIMEETVTVELQDYSTAEPKGVSSIDIQPIKNYIDDHFTEELSLESVAAALYMNKSYLSKRFKKTYGTTVNTYIQQMRITKAKGLLRFSNSSVEEIGIAVGYTDSNYFSRQFRKLESMSPSEYRKQW